MSKWQEGICMIMWIYGFHSLVNGGLDSMEDMPSDVEFPWIADSCSRMVRLRGEPRPGIGPFSCGYQWIVVDPL